MSDYLLSLASHPVTRRLVRSVGAPTPQRLARVTGPYEAEPLAGARVVLGALGTTTAGSAVRDALTSAGASIAPVNGAATEVAVFDATGFRGVRDLRALYDFFQPIVRNLAVNARIVVVGATTEHADSGELGATRRGIEGFVRSLAKEVGRHGATANLVYVEPGAEERLDGVIRFLTSPRSAYVDGQPIRITPLARAPAQTRRTAPLAGKVALVTGAARGIGAATVARLAAEGARVLLLDLPSEATMLAEVARFVGGTPLSIDVAESGAAGHIADVVRQEFGSVDIVVHNAGVTRDKTLAKMDERQWESCLTVNLEAIVAIDRTLERASLLNDEGRIVCLSSIAGVAGNVGQTNYATTKAAVIGYVATQARLLAGRGICVNAVAPGFIETRMMLAVPFLFREIARRGNSLSQGGVPLDAAELITFLATPGACGITGQTIRLCGQNLIGA